MDKNSKIITNVFVFNSIDFITYSFVLNKSDACQMKVSKLKFDKQFRQNINDLIMSLDYNNLLIAKYMVENDNKMDK